MPAGVRRLPARNHQHRCLDHTARTVKWAGNPKGLLANKSVTNHYYKGNIEYLCFRLSLTILCIQIQMAMLF